MFSRGMKSEGWLEIDELALLCAYLSYQGNFLMLTLCIYCPRDVFRTL